MKKIIELFSISVVSSVIVLLGYIYFFESSEAETTLVNGNSNLGIVKTNLSTTPSIENTDFTVAAELSINTVVHVKNTSTSSYQDPLGYFFGGSNTREYSQVGTGSGVIISSDGYILTNRHVVNNASAIEITLNNRKVYKAEVIGEDETNDLALLKIDERNLPYITFGDSDNVKVGEWVLAVGNPYNLTSTVTAGIVSAKGRDLKESTSTDSFIQTDAAVNQGNSGGALVNNKGELIGINTAITSGTGSFIGYSFAVPSNIAKKVIEDIIEFGDVQKAILGVEGTELNGAIAKEFDTEASEGFYINKVQANTGAKKAGIKSGDIILNIDGVKITSFADLTGYLRTKRPDESVNVTYLRGDKQYKANVTLSKSTEIAASILGLELTPISKQELEKIGLSNGVKIKSIDNETLEYYGVKPGDVITSINNVEIKTPSQANGLLSNNYNDVLSIGIVNSKGVKERYIFR